MLKAIKSFFVINKCTQRFVAGANDRTKNITVEAEQAKAYHKVKSSSLW